MELASAAAERYAACMADMEQLASCSHPEHAVPKQLRGMEEQLQHRLEVRCGCQERSVDGVVLVAQPLPGCAAHINSVCTLKLGYHAVCELAALPAHVV